MDQKILGSNPGRLVGLGLHSLENVVKAHSSSFLDLEIEHSMWKGILTFRRGVRRTARPLQNERIPDLSPAAPPHPEATPSQ